MRRLFVAFCLWGVGVGGAWADPQVPITDFFIEPAANSPMLSPSGRFLSVIRDHGDTETIAIADIERKEPIRMIPTGGGHVLWLRWASDDRLLVGLLLLSYTSDGKFLIDVASRTVAFDRNGGRSVTLFEGERGLLRNNRFTSNVSFLPDDREHVLIPLWQDKVFNLYKVNIYDGQFEKISKGKRHTIKWLSDSSGIPKIRIDSNKRGTMLYFYRYEEKQGDWALYKTFNVKKDEPPEFWPISPGKEPGQFYVMATPDGEDRSAIYLYDLESSSYLEKVYSHPKVDLDSPILTDRGRRLVGATYYEDRLGFLSDWPQIIEPFEYLNAQFNNESNVEYVDMNDDGTRALLYVSGPRRPGEYYIYTFPTKDLDRINNRWPELSENELGQMEIVHFKSRDGMDLTAYVTHPVGRDGVMAPTVVLPHGGPEARDYYDFDPMVQFLASRGYRVLQVNFRGSSGYGRHFAESGYGEWGGKMQNDLEDGARMLMARNLSSSDNMCIAGASYGGYAALLAAQRNNGLFKCAISISGISDLPDFLSFVRKEEGQDSDAYLYWTEAIGDPSKDSQRLRLVSPARNASSIGIPILLVHGDLDEIVPIKQSEKMKGALKRLGKTVRFVTIEEEGHSYWDNENEMELYQEMETFLGNHLTGQF